MDLKETLKYFEEIKKIYPTRNQFADLYQLFNLLDNSELVCLEDLNDPRIRNILTDMLESSEWAEAVDKKTIENQIYFFKRSDCGTNFADIFVELCKFLKFLEDDDFKKMQAADYVSNEAECFGVQGPPAEYVAQQRKDEEKAAEMASRRPKSLVELATEQAKEKSNAANSAAAKKKSTKDAPSPTTASSSDSAKTKKRKAGQADLDVEDFETWKKNKEKTKKVEDGPKSIKKDVKPKKAQETYRFTESSFLDKEKKKELQDQLEKRYQSLSFNTEKDMEPASSVTINYDNNARGYSASGSIQNKKLEEMYQKKKSSFN